MASRNINDLHPTLKTALEKALQLWTERHPSRAVPFPTATHRSNEEQDEHYNRPWDGKDNNGNGRVDERAEKITNARAGQSPHNYIPALAFDIAFKTKSGKLDWSLALFKDFNELVQEVSTGIEWGGTFRSLPDAPHWQLRNWKQHVKPEPVVLRLTSPYIEGEDVKRLQLALGITADGVFGPKTAQAVKNYQRVHRMKIDGIVGESTLKALNLT